jgi:hypothetical protein
MWHSQIDNALQQEQYEIVAQFYEQILETETDILSHYWYLGLAYLLQEKEEEAQLTWLLPLSIGSAEEIEQCTTDLVNILDQEAERQAKLEKDEMAWLIRIHLKEIDSQQLHNYLRLIALEIKLNLFTPERLEEWQINNLLQKESPNQVSNQLLVQILSELIKHPFKQILEFFKACLPYIQESNFLVNSVTLVIINHAYQVYHPEFAAELIQLCLVLQPHNIYLKNNLFLLYKSARQYSKALEVAEDIYQNSKNLSLKLHSNAQKLEILLEQGTWLSIEPLI